MRLTLPAVAALLSVITLTAQVQSPSAEAGRITGHVVTGYAELVADATVTLLGRPNDQGLRRTTRTDSTGSFSFAELPAGSYRISATKPGYTSRQLTDGGESLAALDDRASGRSRTGCTCGCSGRCSPNCQHRRSRHPPRWQCRSGHPRRRGGIRFSLQVSEFETTTTSQHDGRYEITGFRPENTWSWRCPA